MRSKLLVATALAASGLIAAGLGGCGGGSEASTSAPAAQGSSELSGVAQDGLTLGNAAAPRTLAVYADIQCPFCQQWDENELPGIVEQHVRSGDLRLEYRGLAFIGPESDLGLRAVLAAGMQDKLWSLVNVLYANQGAENTGWLTEDSLHGFVGSIPGLDVDKLFSDLSSAEVEMQMEDARAAAVQAGVNSTPSFQVGPTGGTLTVVSQDDLQEALTR
jgi:protein-disulfide isomerase